MRTFKFLCLIVVVLILSSQPVMAANSVLSGFIGGEPPKSDPLPGNCQETCQLSYQVFDPVTVASVVQRN